MMRNPITSLRKAGKHLHDALQGIGKLFAITIALLVIVMIGSAANSGAKETGEVTSYSTSSPYAPKPQWGDEYWGQFDGGFALSI